MTIKKFQRKFGNKCAKTSTSEDDTIFERKNAKRYKKFPDWQTEKYRLFTVHPTQDWLDLNVVYLKQNKDLIFIVVKINLITRNVNVILCCHKYGKMFIWWKS